MVTPPIFMGSGDSDPFWSNLSDGYTTGEADDLITRYDIEQFPVIPTALLGFILNY